MGNCSMHSIHPVFSYLFGRVGGVGVFWIFVVPNVFPPTSHIFSSTPKWVPNIFLKFSACSSLCPYAFPNFVKLKPTKLSQYWDFIYIWLEWVLLYWGICKDSFFNDSRWSSQKKGKKKEEELNLVETFKGEPTLGLYMFLCLEWTLLYYGISKNNNCNNKRWSSKKT